MLQVALVMPHETKVLLPEQFLLVTLMVKLAVVAVLSTMLVRFQWFRRILLTEKRDWPERLVFAASLGVPLTAGVLARFDSSASSFSSSVQYVAVAKIGLVPVIDDGGARGAFPPLLRRTPAPS